MKVYHKLASKKLTRSRVNVFISRICFFFFGSVWLFFFFGSMWLLAADTVLILYRHLLVSSVNWNGAQNKNKKFILTNE